MFTIYWWGKYMLLPLDPVLFFRVWTSAKHLGRRRICPHWDWEMLLLEMLQICWRCCLSPLALVYLCICICVFLFVYLWICIFVFVSVYLDNAAWHVPKMLLISVLHIFLTKNFLVFFVCGRRKLWGGALKSEKAMELEVSSGDGSLSK